VHIFALSRDLEESLGGSLAKQGMPLRSPERQWYQSKRSRHPAWGAGIPMYRGTDPCGQSLGYCVARLRAKNELHPSRLGGELQDEVTYLDSHMRGKPA
jgi:hypothetical protein